jgi:hypothetical protein
MSIKLVSPSQRNKQILSLIKKNFDKIDSVKFETNWSYPLRVTDRRKITGHSLTINFTPGVIHG